MNVAVGHFDRMWQEPGPLDPRSDFPELYSRYRPRLVRLIQRRTGDRALAEDIAQTTLERLLNHINEIDPRVPVWPWMKTVALHLAADHFRDREHEVLGGGSCDQATEEGLCYEDVYALKAAMERLSPRQRVALSLRYLEGWKSSEAAAFLGMSRQSFEQLLLRARNRIRCEYRRVTRDALGMFPVVKWIRARRAELSARLPRFVQTSEGLGVLGPSTLSHLVAGTMAIVLAGSAAAVPPVGRTIDAKTVSAIPNDLDTGKESTRAGEGAAAGSSDGSSSTSRGNHGSAAVAGGAAGELVDDVTNPNRDVEDPEDARIVSLAIVPDGPDEGRTIFAGGRTQCRVEPCPPVLFSSSDAGGSWELLPARGLQGTEIIVPSGYGSVHRDVYAMGPGGLQLSDDGGRSFELVTPTSTPFTTGSIAASPGYGAGDRTILIGAQTLMRYDAATGALTPQTSTALPGPFEPVFSSGYPADPRIVLGSRLFGTDGLRSAVSTCDETTCDSVPLDGSDEVPKIRRGLEFQQGQMIYAFTSQGLFRGGIDLSFSRMLLPGLPEERVILADVAVTRAGLIASMIGRSDSVGAGGLFVPDGDSWARVKSSLLRGGAARIVSQGDLVVTALETSGLACSSDSGHTWSRRC